MEFHKKNHIRMKTSCNGPGPDPCIRRYSGIWGAADEAVLKIVRKKIFRELVEIFLPLIGLINIVQTCG